MTQEIVAQSREHQIEELLVAAGRMHAVSARLLDPKLRAENEAHAARMARRIETNAIHDHARGRQ